MTGKTRISKIAKKYGVSLTTIITTKVNSKF